MATKWGVDGKLKVSDNLVAEVREWTLEETQDIIEDTAMGDTWRTFITDSGLKSWTAQVTAMFDETDTTGQQALAIGQGVSVKLMPEGDTSGDYYYSGTAVVESVSVEVPHDNLIMRRISLRGSGTLTKTTV